jgi:hydrogenase maturation protease
MAERDGRYRALVLGIGNLLWADEGFGIRAVEALHQGFAFPEDVVLLDGGTQGLYLLPHVQNADRLVVFDAVDYGLAPGTLKVVRNDDIPAYLGVNKMSLHQSSFQEVLSLAMLSGKSPRDMVLVGVQPGDVRDYGGSLTAAVKARVPEVVAIAADALRSWGIACTTRDAPPREGLNARSLGLDAYEQGRPPEEEAFRGGDARFINALIEEKR